MILPGDISTRDNLSPVRVPPGKLFMMGDNRDNSWDSRFWGFLPVENVKGKALFLYWSWDHTVPWIDVEHAPWINVPHKVRWSRILTLIK
jgi:hypothetical protein